MKEVVKVVVDAMGGDNAPYAPVKGAVDAVASRDDVFIYLVGQQDVVQAELDKYSYPKDKIEIVHASQVIETAEPPVNAIRGKKDSSIVVGLNMIRHEEADALGVLKALKDRRWHRLFQQRKVCPY